MELLFLSDERGLKMFYRIKDNNIYDYADYEYADDCLFTDICSMKVFETNPENYIIEDGLIKNAGIEIIAERRKNQFEKDFFETSLGWIRRKVTMLDGSIKDFLADLLLPIKAGMEIGQQVKIITYKTPDFTVEPTVEYMKSLQEIKYATYEFIEDCLFQTVSDFGLNQGGNDGI